MRAIAKESVYLSMVAGSPGARNVPVLILDSEIEAMLRADGIDTSRINHLRWSFLGAAHPSDACVLLDLNDADAAAIVNGLNPLNFHLSDAHAVQMWPIRMETLKYGRSGIEGGSPGSTTALRLLHLTDARGIVGMGGTFATGESGQAARDQPRIVNQTLDMPLHFAGVSQWTEQNKTQAGLEVSVTVRYQATNSVTKMSGLVQAAGLSGRTTGGEGSFVDGRPVTAVPLLGVSALAPLIIGGAENPANLPAPIDFPIGPGAELQAVDSALSLRGWMMAYCPAWTSTTVQIGSVPCNPFRLGTADAYANRMAAFLSIEPVGGRPWSEHAWSGAFARSPSTNGQYLQSGSVLAVQASAQLPPQTFSASIQSGAVSDLFDQMPDYVIPTLQRGEVLAKTLTASPSSMFDYEIMPAARTSGMRLNSAGAQSVRRLWQFSAIPPSGTPEKDPLQNLGAARTLRLDLTDYAIVDPVGNVADTPLNLSSGTPIGSQINSYFQQGTVESNARRAATDFYGRFLCAAGEATFFGLLVFDSETWWPGLQYVEYTFARGGTDDADPRGVSTTRVWGDFWHPAFGFVRSTRNSAGRWRLDRSRPMTGAGSLGVDAPSGVERAKGDVPTGHVAQFLGLSVESKPIRFDTATNLPVAWAYRVRISHPTSAQYGLQKPGASYIPENSGTLAPDKNYSDLWVANIDEVSNTGGNSLHGTGQRVNYSPGAGDPQVISLPVSNGIPVTILAFQTDTGGTVYAMKESGPYDVICTEAAASLVEPTSFDPFSWFSGGIVTQASGSTASGGESLAGADCGCGGAS